MGSVADEAVAASRRLHPEAWEKADRIARIIDPGAFGRWYDATGPDAKPIKPSTRIKAKRARARRKAWDILRLLGEVPEETDWMAIFEEMGVATPTPTGEEADDG